MSILTGIVEVDSEALAVHLKCSPAYVRLLVSKGVITPSNRRVRNGRGRPACYFNAIEVDEQLARAEAEGLVRLDNGRWRVQR